MARITKQFRIFNEGMSPYITVPEKINRIEHFDTVDGKMRPFRELVTDGNNFTYWRKFTKATGFASLEAGNSLVALAGGADGATGQGLLVQWDASNWRWDTSQYYGMTALAGVFANICHYYGGKLYGLRTGNRYLWEAASMESVNESKADLGASFTYYANFITHSKDMLMYIPVDNKLFSWNGSSLSAALLTFGSDYRITSIAEKDDYILIVGYDVKTGKATGFLWDRDSSLTTLTAKYDLEKETPYFCAVLSGVPIIISLRTDTSNTEFTDNNTLVIRTVENGQAKIFKEFKFNSLTLEFESSYITQDKIYFSASFTTILEGGGGHYVIFSIDSQGRLEIAQNCGINDTPQGVLMSVLRDGDGFWVGTTADSFFTDTTYATTSVYETSEIISKNLAYNVDYLGSVLTFEPLPSGASVVLKARKNEETSWTTLATYNTQNQVKGTNVNNGAFSTAKKMQFRIESTGGGVVTGFQYDLEENKSEDYE